MSIVKLPLKPVLHGTESEDETGINAEADVLFFQPCLVKNWVKP